jgi:V8-like Glu-specific endopeptidase
MALPVPAHAAVIGDDDRQSIGDSQPALARGIGFILEAGSAYTCTAFCVADDVIATSAHCILRRDRNLSPVDLSKVRFHMFDRTPAVRRGGTEPAIRSIRAGSELQTGPGSQTTTAVFHGEFSTNRDSPRHFDDWALAKLQTPLCERRALSLEPVSQDELRGEINDQKLYMIGYHGGRFEEGRIRSSDCDLNSIRMGRFMRSQRQRFANAPDLLLHRCDMEQGASGSPIFLETEDGPKVVAMNSGSVSHLIYQVRPGSERRLLVSRYDANTAVLTRSFAGGVERFGQESLLHSESQLRRLQLLLKARGLYAGPLDALYGPGTRGAILKFEQERGWARLGVPTLELLVALEEGIGAQLVGEDIRATSGATGEPQGVVPAD